MKESIQFYNNFDQKLIRDYISGNIRIESAIKELAPFIPENAAQILDLGCGLGWSSHEFSKHFKNAKVQGVDLSPVLVERASKLFENNNLNYLVYDVTKGLPNQKYDAVVMIDVYEHIPQKDRKNFHKALAGVINDQGRLILACPTKFHQDWLKKNRPEGLQPVDEDVDNQTVLDIANDIHGEVIHFAYKKIWGNFDYLYAVIEINPIYNSIYSIESKTKINLEVPELRVQRINEALNLKLQLPLQKTKTNKFVKKVKNKLKLLFR